MFKVIIKNEAEGIDLERAYDDSVKNSTAIVLFILSNVTAGSEVRFISGNTDTDAKLYTGTHIVMHKLRFLRRQVQDTTQF